MGCYDTVLVPCPKCGELSEFQTKSGDCALETYKLAEAPLDVMYDVNRHAPTKCKKCGCYFDVDIEARKSVEVEEHIALATKDDRMRRFRTWVESLKLAKDE